VFTGIVEAVGEVWSFDGLRLVVDCPFGADLADGESVAVDGCCLTQLPGFAPRFAADLSGETRARTTLGRLQRGQLVNLERAMPLGARLGGHLVQGHVDGTTTLLAVHEQAVGRRHVYRLDEEDAPFVVPQGSVAIDGVSLTVAALAPGRLEVALIPHTLASTTLGDHAEGRASNVEFDLAGKYLLRAAVLSGRVDVTEAVRRRLGASATIGP
jgi:riboflavin synthase